MVTIQRPLSQSPHTYFKVMYYVQKKSGFLSGLSVIMADQIGLNRKLHPK